MKKLITLLVLLVLNGAAAQSWQWGKRGGSTDLLETTNDFRQEEVYSIVTDSNKNIYVLSSVGKNGLDIDGVSKTNYGSTTQITDIALSSFACDGTYRWSKIIGGNSYDRVNKLQIDNEDNIYISGKSCSCGNVTYPPRIEDDVLLPQNPIDCSVVFLAKYNSNGVLQWFKRPQPAGTSSSVGLSDTLGAMPEASLPIGGHCAQLDVKRKRKRLRLAPAYFHQVLRLMDLEIVIGFYYYLQEPM